MDSSQARGKVLDALSFAASLRGPGEFATAAELVGETGLSSGGSKPASRHFWRRVMCRRTRP